MAAWIQMPLGMELDLGPGDCVLDGDPAPLPKKGAEHDKKFWPMFLGPNGWMDQDGTWHGGRPQPRRLSVRWGPSPLPKKWPEPRPQFSGHFYCGQTAGCIKTPLGMEVGLSPEGFMLGGDPAPPQKGGGAPQLLAHVYCGQTVGCIKMALGMEVGLSPGDFVLDGALTPSLCNFWAYFYCGQTAGCIKMSLGVEVGLNQRTLC